MKHMSPESVSHVVADRLRPFGETVFAEFSRLAIEHDAINLGQGFPSFDGPEFVKEAAIKAIRDGKGQYAPSPGVPELLQAIAARWQASSGISVDPASNVTVTSGCTEALMATFLGLINPGDEVVLFEPYYDSYRACVSMAGAIPRFVTLKPPSFTFDASDLESAISDRTRAILLNTPHNPTGRVFSREELELIADAARDRDLLVISDEVYEHLVFEGQHLSIAALDGMGERTVTLSSLGKTFSLTGWKVGWAIASPELTTAIRRAHQFITFSVPTPLQYGAVAAMEAPQSYFDSFVSDYRGRRDILVSGLRKAGFQLESPQGTYFVLADHTAFGFPNDVSFCRHLVTHCGVVAIPPSAFYADPADGRTLVRFAFCKDVPMLQEAMSRLESLSAG